MASGYLLSPLGSYITDRFGYRFTAILGSLSGIVGFLLATLWMLYLTYGVLSGFGFRMIYNSSTLVVVDYFVKWRSLAVGIVTSASAVGMLVMSQVTEVLLNAFGWQATLRGFAALYFVCGLCSTVFVPLDKFKEDTIYNNSTNENSQSKKTGNFTLYNNRSFLVLLSSFIVVNFSYFIPSVHIVSA